MLIGALELPGVYKSIGSGKLLSALFNHSLLTFYAPWPGGVLRPTVRPWYLCALEIRESSCAVSYAADKYAS
jgi:hypothetical protein